MGEVGLTVEKIEGVQKRKVQPAGCCTFWIRSCAIWIRGKGLGRFDYDGPQPPVGELLSSEPTPMATGCEVRPSCCATTW
jgi:hypothetical protein